MMQIISFQNALKRKMMRENRPDVDLTYMAGADHVVIGTDHPFDMGPDDPVGSVDAIPELTTSEREYVCSLTARALLGED